LSPSNSVANNPFKSQGGHIYETIGEKKQDSMEQKTEYRAEVVVANKSVERLQINSPLKFQPPKQPPSVNISVPVMAKPTIESTDTENRAFAHSATVVTGSETTKTSSGPVSMNQLKEILSGGQTENQDISHNILFGDDELKDEAEKAGDEDANKTEDNKTNDEDKERNKEQDGTEESRSLVTRFREFKEKTLSEVTKITRGRSLHRASKKSETDGAESIQTDRARSESRSQKAGRLMKGFTSNILKKR